MFCPFVFRSRILKFSISSFSIKLHPVSSSRLKINFVPLLLWYFSSSSVFLLEFWYILVFYLLFKSLCLFSCGRVYSVEHVSVLNSASRFFYAHKTNTNLFTSIIIFYIVMLSLMDHLLCRFFEHFDMRFGKNVGFIRAHDF